MIFQNREPLAGSIVSRVVVQWIGVLAIAMAAGAAWGDDVARPQPPAPGENVWYAIFAAGSRIGTSHTWSQPDTYNGAPAVLEMTDTTMSLIAFGTSVQQKVVGREWSAVSDGAPLYETFSMESGGATTSVTARYFPDHIDAALTSGGSTTHKKIVIPPGVKVSASDVEHGIMNADSLHKGQVITSATFDPMSLQLETYTFTVQDLKQSVDDPYLGPVKDLTVFHVAGPEGDVSLFEDAEGEPVLLRMAAGLEMRREDPAMASLSEGGAPGGSAPTYMPPTDFAVATAVSQDGAAIAKPRDCRYLKIELSSPGAASQVIEVRSVDAAESTATVEDAAADKTLAPYLADAPYLSLDDSAVVKQALDLRAGKTKLADIVVRTRDWVYATMRPTATLGLPRAAASVLQDPRGVCRDYAILYTALARAEGVPTRICAGLVAFGGKFYYHAWAESYIGGVTGWLPVDPTMKSRTVDATHIALSRGNPTSIFDVASEIGRVQARIIDASY